jgi:hypothetical protein
VKSTPSVVKGTLGVRDASTVDSTGATLVLSTPDSIAVLTGNVAGSVTLASTDEGRAVAMSEALANEVATGSLAMAEDDSSGEMGVSYVVSNCVVKLKEITYYVYNAI